MIRTAPYLFLIFWLGCAAAGPQVASTGSGVIELAPAPPSIGARVEDLASGDQHLGFPPGASGALLREILYHGPAHRAHLSTGDLIQAVDGVPVASAGAFLKAMAERSPGDEVKLSVLRGPGRLEAVLPLADAVELYTAACDREDGFGCQSLGALYEQLGTSAESTALAAEIYRKACDLGYTSACGESPRREER